MMKIMRPREITSTQLKGDMKEGDMLPCREGNMLSTVKAEHTGPSSEGSQEVSVGQGHLSREL